jgi:methionyl-tRNA synthetase
MKILVTSALPYANGSIHLGHLAGCYLPADIYFKFQKYLMGKDVIHICGTDEHGVPITIEAEKNKMSPRELVDFYHKDIKETFEKLFIEFTYFGGTAREIHYKLVQEFFLKIYEKGYIEKREEEGLYCENCNRFLPDRYVEGICPYCNSSGARGDQCEVCGRWLDPNLLLEPKCKICSSTPIKKKTFHYYFLLPKLQEKLYNWLKEKNYWKQNVLNYAISWIKEGLRARSITRDLEWGVPVPLEEAKNKVLYVWFDAPIGYISITKEWAEKIGKKDLWKEYWMDENTKLIHFIGKDNIVFHALIWPAMLIAQGEYILPYDIPANEYLNMEGGKMSTSRGMAIWVKDYIKEYPADYLRFGLSLILPETKDSEFSYKEWLQNVNTHLADNFGNLLQRVLTFIHKNFNGRVPERKERGELENKLIDSFEKGINKYIELMESFKFKDALKQVLFISSEVNRYIDFAKPWEKLKKDKEEAGSILSYSIGIINALRVLFFPFIPFSSKKISEILKEDDLKINSIKNPFIDGKEIGKPEILFKKAEEIKIEKKEELIKFEDFNKIDIRIGEIKSVEKILGTDKLLKITVSFGNFERTIVAGIGDSYEINELIGKKITVILNLEPKKIKGVLSEGMLLAADFNNKPVLIIPEKDVPPGVKVK